MQQYIFNTVPATNYGKFDADIYNNEIISGNAKAALLYLLDKPKGWRLRITDLKRKLKVGTNKAYKVLAELRAYGYAVMVRRQKKVEWFFYAQPQTVPPADTPQPPATRAESQSVNFQRVETGDDLDITQTPFITQKTTTPPTATLAIGLSTPAKADVVVSFDNDVQQPLPAPITQPEHTNALDAIVGPSSGITAPATESPATLPTDTATNVAIADVAGIPAQHQRIVKKAMAPLSRKQVLTLMAIFGQALAEKEIKNPTGYFLQLVKAAVAGTLSAVEAPHRPTIDELIRLERQRDKEARERSRVDTAAYLAELERKHGVGAVIRPTKANMAPEDWLNVARQIVGKRC